MIKKNSLKLRIFAGPNGSGKTTIINSIREFNVNGKSIDFGIYVNADDIAQVLSKKSKLEFSVYELNVNQSEFIKIALNSGLVELYFDSKVYQNAFKIIDNCFILKDNLHVQHAQIIAFVIRELLIQNKKKFSFETVFSHRSKIDIIKKAVLNGFKTYLYFVCTEDPEINIFRVKEVRVKQKGHDVPEDKIKSRYFRSLKLLHEAAQNVQQAYFFDNSNEIGKSYFASFKLNKSREKEWSIDKNRLPEWFKKYYKPN